MAKISAGKDKALSARYGDLFLFKKHLDRQILTLSRALKLYYRVILFQKSKNLVQK